ncbi:MAG: D-alanine--D-alanine ligase [Xanthomonadales bacterium]|nr:D-alanine--D-alanine ligase [Xanthomonadales bacterium]
MMIDHPQDFGRVAVVMGGDGSERSVSLDGGRQILAALADQDVNVVAADGIAELLRMISEQRVDRVFNLLHGRGGEDGALQGALQCLGIPVTGSGVRGSAVSMDKSLSKAIWRQAGLNTPDWQEIRDPDAAEKAAARVGYPLVVKPVSEGSSVGISLVRQPGELAPAVQEAFGHERRVMLEALVDGSELTVGILHGAALPAIRIVPARTFYDYEAKYVDDRTRYLCPCGLEQAEEAALARDALNAFEMLGASGWGRVDFLLDQSGKSFLLETNTTPGMTSLSLVPKAAVAAGIEFDRLTWQILETSFQERN